MPPCPTAFWQYTLSGILIPDRLLVAGWCQTLIDVFRLLPNCVLSITLRGILTGSSLQAGDRPCSVFFDGLKSLPTLTFLELGNCSLSAAAVAELAAVTSLTTLSVFGNSTGDEVLVKMSEAMGTLGAGGQQRPRAFCTLHVLSLSGNKLSLDGLRTFLEALVQLPKEVRSNSPVHLLRYWAASRLPLPLGLQHPWRVPFPC